MDTDHFRASGTFPATTVTFDMPVIERCAGSEQMPPLEPLSEASSLHESSKVAPLHSGTLHGSTAPSTPKQKSDRDAGFPFGDVKPPFKLSLVLENKGNVARDHLASERTYLAYVRTSLATSSAGVALVQLFTLSSTSSGVDVSKFAKPLGATIILLGLLILVQGVIRYFMTQRSLVRGYFPVARSSITAIAFILGSLVGIVFGVLVAGTQR